MDNKELISRTTIKVRFSEVDSMRIVWHGQYIRYFEDGREDFGNIYNISYLDFHNRGILIPIVKINCEYKKPLLYGETAIIETRFVNHEAAKIQYDYIIYESNTRDIVATGSSLQVFLNMKNELLLTFPPFFLEWKENNGLLANI